MAVVGSAEVVVRAITNKVKQDIEKAFNDALPAVRKAGDQAGKDFANSFGRSVGPGLSNAANSAFDSIDGRAAGERAGKDFADGMADAVGGGGGGGRLGDVAEREMGGAGRRGGNAFNRALNSAWADAASGASAAFTSIFAMGNIIGTGIAGAVAAVSSLVSGLFAVASSAAAATASLAALPGILGAVLQGGIALKLAFSGVGAAVSAGMKSATQSAKQAGAAGASNANAIADAQKNLQRAYQDAARAKFDADKRITRASAEVAEAEREVLAVTKELNKARREAAESLQQLAFNAEDAALAEERAQMSLEDAYVAYQQVANLPADDRSRRDAELSYKEAELAYRQAKDRNADLAKEQKKAAKAGVEGSDEVVAAKKKINDAQKNAADKEQALADARMAAARQEEDSARRIADAQTALQRALASSAAAKSSAASAADKYQDALSNLSPAAQTFVKYLVSLQGEFKNLRAAAGAELFPKLQTALQPIVTKLFPVFETQLRRTGGILGQYAIGISNAVTRGNLFERLMQGQNKTLNVFNRTGDNGRSVMDDLATVFLRVMVALQPLTERFAKWVATVIEGWEAATRGEEAMGRMEGYFSKAGDRAALLGDIIGNLFSLFRGLGKAADPAGTGLLDSFNKYTKGLSDFVNSAEGQDKLQTYFQKVADNVRAISRLVRAVGRAFTALGDNEGVGKFADSLVPAVENFGKMGDNMAAASPALGKFIENISELMLVFADTGGITLFFDILNKALEPLVAFAKTDFGQGFLVVAGAIAAVTRAFSFLFKMGGKVVKILVGGFVKPLRWLQRLKGGGDSAEAGLRGVARGSDAAKAALERQMVTDKKKIATLKRLETQSLRTAGALDRVKTSGAPAAGAAATAAPVPPAATKTIKSAASRATISANPGAAAAAAAGPTSRLGKIAAGAAGGVSKLGKGFSALSMGLLGVSGPVLAVVAGIALLGVGLVKLYKASPEFKKFVDGIVGKLKAMGEWFKGILTNYVLPFLNGFFAKVNEYMPKIKSAIGTALSAVGSVFSTVFGAVSTVVKFVFGLIKGYVTNVWLPTVRFIWGALQTMWGVARVVFSALRKAVGVAFNAVKAVWQAVLRPVLDGLKAAFRGVRAVVNAVVGFMITRWDNFKTNMGKLKTFIVTVASNIRGRFESIREKVSAVVSGVGEKFTNFKTSLDTLWEKIKTVVGNIKSKFGEIAGSVKNAFEGLAGKVTGPLNAFIRFMNKHLIGNVNKVTSKFGLTIGNIPEVKGYAKGGYTGNMSPSAIAGVVHGDEHVIKSSSRRAIERAAPGALDYMNKTGKLPVGGIDLWPGKAPDLGLGKLRDLAGQTVGGIKDIGGEIARKGVGKVLETLVDGAKGLMKGVGIKRGSFINDLFYGIMDELADSAKKWGGKQGKQPGGEIPPKAGPWTNPLPGSIITQRPNAGHRPTWSVDLAGVPAGSAVRAASAGTVRTAVNLGNRSYGQYVVLEHAKGIRTLYAHLSSMAVRVGQRVSSGAKIGAMGSTGNSSGPHLHFELMPGSDTIAEMRKRGVKLAQGGVAKATPGGVLSVIAEAGHNERVEPLDSEGMSKRDRAMIAMVQAAASSGNKGGDTFKIYPSAGMDEAALAMMVSRRVSWRRSVGT